MPEQSLNQLAPSKQVMEYGIVPTQMLPTNTDLVQFPVVPGITMGFFHIPEFLESAEIIFPQQLIIQVMYGYAACSMMIKILNVAVISPRNTAHLFGALRINMSGDDIAV